MVRKDRLVFQFLGESLGKASGLTQDCFANRVGLRDRLEASPLKAIIVRLFQQPVRFDGVSKGVGNVVRARR